MAHDEDDKPADSDKAARLSKRGRVDQRFVARAHPRKGQLARRVYAIAGVVAVAGTVGSIWLVNRAESIGEELNSAAALVPQFKAEVVSQDSSASHATLETIVAHTSKAREQSADPIWKIAAAIPGFGRNFSVVSEVAIASDEIASGSGRALLGTTKALNLDEIGPVDGRLNLEPLRQAAPSIQAAARTLDLTYQRIRTIEKSGLLPQVASPLANATEELGELSRSVQTLSQASALLPPMLGSNEPRTYLVLVQNNAEVRATGGLSGVLALLRVDKGSIALVSESTGSALGRTNPPVSVDREQTEIYSRRLGTFIGDVNLTPDFPTAANTAKNMWEKHYGGVVDGVVAMDPIVLAHLLKASGPISVSDASPATTGRGLPTKLTSENVVPTLLNDVYKRLETNDAQDAYFAAASHSVFDALSSGKVKGPALLKSLSTSYEENRLHVWSSHKEEQDILADIPLGGSISGPSNGGASFGVYFNDGTGAKMDFYVRRKVELTKTCTNDGYASFNVKVELKNTASVDAATALPAAITGGGRFGVPAGSVQTNVVVYGPSQAQVDTASQDGIKISLGSHLHNDRPVGVVSAQVAPGGTTTLEMTFLKVVQDTVPLLVVTPTVQTVNDVTSPLQTRECP